MGQTFLGSGLVSFVFSKLYCTFAPEMAKIKKIGHIVAKKPPKNTRQYVGMSSKDTCDGLPVLYVGLKNAKEHIENFNILDKNPKDGVYWTFLKTEKREDYEADIERFYSELLVNLSKKVRYYYVNPFKLTIEKTKKILSILFSVEEKCIYISNGMLYFAYQNNVLGVSLVVLEYIGVNTGKWLNKLRACKSNKVYDEDTKQLFYLDRELRSKGLIYLMPHLLS